jgi:hypothetical protein
VFQIWFSTSKKFSECLSHFYLFSHARNRIQSLVIWKIRCRMGPTCRPHLLIAPGPHVRTFSQLETMRGHSRTTRRRGLILPVKMLFVSPSDHSPDCMAARLLPALCDGALSVSSTSLPLHSRSQEPTPAEWRSSCTRSRELASVPSRRCEAEHNVFASLVGCCRNAIVGCDQARPLHH